ncbi:MAG TPA: diguanylate cyclase [Gammaproteobacteria bacterium]|nr:diguanylate cyclase [Gammaproteobacteria bacterium]
MKEISVSDLMTRDIELMAPGTPLREVITRMQRKRHSCTLIGSHGSPEGIITERDLVQVLQKLMDDPDLAGQPAAAFMSTPPHTVQQDQSLFDALVISRAEHVRHLPVVDDDQQLVGLLTQTDLTRAHFRVTEMQQVIIERAIKNRTEELLNANRELESLCMEDALLGIGNRRSMEVDMQHTHSLAGRYQRPYTVALLDIDYFKRYNDHYGHQAGDRALQQVTGTIGSAIRASDRLYRYGGEELLLLLPDTVADGGARLCQRLVRELFDTAIPHCKSPYGVITISAGLVDSLQPAPGAGQDWQEVVHRADQALYQAKHLGRNRVA